jgi:nicotinamide riboside kinase
MTIEGTLTQEQDINSEDPALPKITKVIRYKDLCVLEKTMLVGFIGSPCSGKTTTAAKLFAELKDMGLPTDYIAERARVHIAQKRFFQRKLGQGDTVVLTDEDQDEIFKQQFTAEIQTNDPRSIIITDASALNTLMYMSESLRTKDLTKFLADVIVREYDLLFVCSPVQRPDGVDLNRIHDAKASEEIHSRIETVIMPLIKDKTVINLAGPSRTRLQDAMSAVLNAFNSVG